MKYEELQTELEKYVYSEDDGMLRASLASILVTRLKIGDPLWMILIGPSSSGKSQVLRPLALTDEKFIHKIDDLTENTFLSGIVRKSTGQGKDLSLLKRIGNSGIIVISDFTVIFSKSIETKQAILSQFRMIYDGEMTKYTGTSDKPISWKGRLGVLAGSTPSIYHHFEEVADMGERFIYYRMKPYDVEKATRKSLSRSVFGKELDEKLSTLYADYLMECVQPDIIVPNIAPVVYDRIVYASLFAAKMRTPIHYDRFNKSIDRIPVSEMPMRIALQLMALAKGLSIMRFHDDGTFDLTEKDIQVVEWVAYSLANEERRACMKFLAKAEREVYTSQKMITDHIGLSPEVVNSVLHQLAAVELIKKISYSADDVSWRLNPQSHGIVRRLEGLETIEQPTLETVAPPTIAALEEIPF